MEQNNRMSWTWTISIFSLFLLYALTSQADANALLAQLRVNFTEKPSAVRESLIPGLYGVYFNASEPRSYVDDKFRFVGNSSTGYTYLSGHRRGQGLTSQESKQLFLDVLAAIPREKLITYRFGNGRREIFLFSAYDCPNCRSLEKELVKQAKTLNAVVYVIPTALSYSSDPRAKPLLQGVLCADNREEAWSKLITKGLATTVSGECAANTDNYAFLSRSFPVNFPASVPTAVTSDGHIYPLVLAKFDEIFRGK